VLTGGSGEVEHPKGTPVYFELTAAALDTRYPPKNSSGVIPPASVVASTSLQNHDIVGYDGSKFVPVVNKSAYWLPAGIIDENVPSRLASGTATIESGKLQLHGNFVVPAGVTVSNVTYCSGTQAAVEPTHWWFCVVELSTLKIRAVSADQTTTAWAAKTVMPLAMGTPWTPTEDTAVYTGILMVATTLVNIVSGAATAEWMKRKPSFGGTSNTGLTTPLAVGTAVTEPGSLSALPAAALS
jgi:hypothetical protein